MSIIYLKTKSPCANTGSPRVPCTLRKFYDRLKNHDWYYTFSDDFGVWQLGNAAEAELKAMAQLSPEHAALYNGFSQHYFSGESWGTPKAPLPVRP